MSDNIPRSVMCPAVGARNQPEDYEADLWNRLATLLPTPDDATDFLECRDIGEQEAGLDLLVRLLRESRIPIGDTTRAELEALAEQWGVRLALHDEIASCIRDPDADGSLRLLPDDQAIPTDHAAIGLTDAESAELLLAPWIECTHCGRTLGRTHHMEEWGELSYLASRYIVWASPGTDGEAEMFTDTELPEAMRSLLSCSAANRSKREII